MSTPTSSALAKRSAENALMPPPPPPKKIKRPSTVIDEEKYTDGITRIIARDFFPGLEEHDSTQEYLNALESRDEKWISEAGQRLTQMMTPGPDGRRTRGRRGVSMTPLRGTAGDTPRAWAGDTPRTEVGSVVGSEIKETEVDTNMSLSAFQQKYVSEDNESFNQILDKVNQDKREKNAWLWNGNRIPRPGDVMRKAQEQRLLEAATAPTASNDLILAIQGKDTRPAMPEYKKMGPKNALMFAPDSLEDVQQTTAQVAQEKSLAAPKSINLGGTRISNPEAEAAPVMPSPSMSAVDAAIIGRPRYSKSEGGYTGAETPQVAGYAFVDAEVQPHEESYMERKARGDRPEEDQVLKLLGPVDSSPNSFTISEPSKREDLNRRMVDKLHKNRRPHQSRLAALAGEETPGRTPTPKFMSATGIRKAPGNLTPAQQSLLGKIKTPLRKGTAWDGSKAKQTSKLAGVTPRANR